MVVESVVATLHPESKQTTSTESSLTVEELSQDGVYTFIVYVQNSVGNVSTQAREICKSNFGVISCTLTLSGIVVLI